MANMVVSVDGRAAVRGRAKPLSGSADRALFHLLRSLADVVVVGAGTVREEGYGPARGDDPPPIAVVSASLDLDVESRFFTEAVCRPLVLTVAAADQARRRTAESVADVIVAGDTIVDVGRALAELRHRGFGVALCEGGPRLLGQVVAADALDELCLSLAPTLAGGTGPHLLGEGALVDMVPLDLRSVLEDDGMLFLRYLRGCADE